MRAAPRWETSPATADAGQETSLQIIGREDGLDGRTVCVIPGNESRRMADGDFVWLLDEQDIANAALFLASADAEFVTGNIVEVDGGRAV